MLFIKGVNGASILMKLVYVCGYPDHLQIYPFAAFSLADLDTKHSKGCALD